LKPTFSRLIRPGGAGINSPFGPDKGTWPPVL
jgi:hypothetical protein